MLGCVWVHMCVTMRSCCDCVCMLQPALSLPCALAPETHLLLFVPSPRALILCLLCLQKLLESKVNFVHLQGRARLIH